MKIWNQTLSKAEALEIYQYKGTAYYPKTKHNSKVMAEVVSEHLTKLRRDKQLENLIVEKNSFADNGKI